MKFTAAIVLAFISAIGFGSTCVAAQSDALATNSFDQLIIGVKTLLDFVLRTLFNGTNSFLFLIFETLLHLITSLVPGSTTLNLAVLLPALLALKKPTLITVVTTLFEVLGVDGAFILELIPASIGRTPISLKELIKTASPLIQNNRITLANLLHAFALYLGQHKYSIKLPSP